MNCSENMEYISNGDPCQPTCTNRNIAEKEDCEQSGKVEMCACKTGYAIDGDGYIPQFECGVCDENENATYNVSNQPHRA